MKLITEPSIYVMQSPTCTWFGQEFLADHGIEWESDAEDGGAKLAEFAGRLCYMSFANPRPGGNAAYLEHIKEAGHGSVLEHATWSFIFTGISRSLTHELVRHRAGFAYSQLSQRYVDESVAEYVCPDIIANDPELYGIWSDAVDYAHAAYVKLADKLTVKTYNQRWPQDGFTTLEQVLHSPGSAYKTHGTELRKQARQAARSVLPNATETKIFVSANARAIRHFLEQRGSRFAEPEIRRLANRLLDIMQVESSALFGDYERVPLPDGTFEITTKYRKV